VGRLYMEDLKHAHIRVDYELGIKFIQLSGDGYSNNWEKFRVLIKLQVARPRYCSALVFIENVI